MCCKYLYDTYITSDCILLTLLDDENVLNFVGALANRIGLVTGRAHCGSVVFLYLVATYTLSRHRFSRMILNHPSSYYSRSVIILCFPVLRFPPIFFEVPRLWREIDWPIFATELLPIFSSTWSRSDNER